MPVQVGDVIKFNALEYWGGVYDIKCPYVKVTGIEHDWPDRAFFLIEVRDVIRVATGLMYYTNGTIMEINGDLNYGHYSTVSQT